MNDLEQSTTHTYIQSFMKQITYGINQYLSQPASIQALSLSSP
jgi:hypothetical protein